MLQSPFAVVVLVAGFVLPATLRAEDVKPIKAVKDMSRSSHAGSFHINKTGAVIRSVEELVAVTSDAKAAKDEEVQKKMVAELTKILGVEAIDWRKQMVVTIIATQIDSVQTEGKGLIVYFTPYKEPLTRAIPATPKHLLLLDRVDGDIKFIPTPMKKDEKKN